MKDAKLCNIPRCMNKRRKHRKVCATCDKKSWRKKHPMKAVFQTLRQNARRRGKVFELTFQQFERFCYKTNFLAGRGRKSVSYSIDRIDNSKGYTVSNIQVLSISDNAKKNKTLVYDYRTGYAKVV